MTFSLPLPSSYLGKTVYRVQTAYLHLIDSDDIDSSKRHVLLVFISKYHFYFFVYLSVLRVKKDIRLHVTFKSVKIFICRYTLLQTFIKR